MRFPLYAPIHLLPHSFSLAPESLLPVPAARQLRENSSVELLGPAKAAGGSPPGSRSLCFVCNTAQRGSSRGVAPERDSERPFVGTFLVRQARMIIRRNVRLDVHES